MSYVDLMVQQFKLRVEQQLDEMLEWLVCVALLLTKKCVGAGGGSSRVERDDESRNLQLSVDFVIVPRDLASSFLEIDQASSKFLAATQELASR